MEVGFDHKTGLGFADNYPLYGNAKIGVPENAFGNIIPEVAVGLLDVGTKTDETDYDVVHIEVTRTIFVQRLSLGRLSLGYFTGNKRLLVDANGTKDNSGIMVAWERTMTELSDKLWLCLDYMGTKSVYGCMNFGASWRLAPNTALLAGYQLYNNSSLIHTLTLQVDVDI